MSRLLLVLLLSLMGGCSEVIPGINIHPDSSGTHQYKVVEGQDSNQYQVVEAGPTPEYRVIEVSPDVLRTLAKEEDASAATDQLPSLLPSDVPPEYKLGPGDVFFVVVWDHPELTAPYTGLTNDLTDQGRLIAADGTTFYPYVGTFRAAGMTSAELRGYIASHLTKVINNPQVDVRIVAYRAGRVEVAGEVMKPATITLDDTPKGVLQAIDLCGGLTPAASRRRVLLVRNGVSYQIDLAGLLSGTKPVPNPQLLAGDVLHIPDQSGDQVFVLGAVGKQAPVIIPQDSMSLSQVLSAAGGIDPTRGKDMGILVFRPHLDAEMKVAANIFALDLHRPEGMLLASQFKLFPHDVVYVQQTAFAQYNSVVNELLPTITAIFELNQLTK